MAVETLVEAPVKEEVVVDNKLADSFDAAADRLELYGWCKGDYGSTWGPNCVAGAMRMELIPGQKWYKLIAYFEDFIGVKPSQITWWNDTQPSADVVIGKLRECADYARNGGI